MTKKKGYKPPLDDSVMPEVGYKPPPPPLLPPEVPPRSMPKLESPSASPPCKLPSSSRALSECIHIEAFRKCGHLFCNLKYDGTLLPSICIPDCPDYATEQPATGTANKCIHNHERGLTCPKAEVVFPPKPHCGLGCSDYATEYPAADAASRCIHNSVCNKRIYGECGGFNPGCPDYATEQPISNSTWAVKQNQKTNCFHRQVSECCGYEWCGKGYESSLPCSFNCYYYADEQLVAHGMARPLAYNPPPPNLQPPEKPPPARPWPRCVHGVLLSDCEWGCGYPYNREYDTTPKQIPVQSSQPKQPRPFVRVDGAGIIFLNDFVLFQVVGKSLNALGQTAIELYTYETDEQAQAALDQIQAAIKHWNRLAREPERNVRLKSITENLDYKSAKARMVEAFTRNDIDAYEIDTLVSISDVWTALSAIMLLTEDFDIPEDQTDVP